MFIVGQKVTDSVGNKGVVIAIDDDIFLYPIVVDFGTHSDNFSESGEFSSTGFSPVFNIKPIE